VSVAVLTAAAPAQRLVGRLALALVAIGLVAGALALLAWLFAPAAPPPPARNPFGMGLREAAPAPGGLGATILALQASFFQTLRAAVASLKESGAAWPTLLGIGFAYGVFHAAGPGHGKAVIAAYVVASERALAKAIGLSLAAALVQALVAVALVAALAAVLQVGAAAMTRASALVEAASFAAVAALGAMLTWRKAGRLVGLAVLARDPRAAAPGPACDHVHLPPPEALARLRDMAGVVLAAGLRPCAGAIVVLVFALAQGLFAAGVAATFAMALGTALTTGAIAALAVFAKRLALRVAGGRGAGGALAMGALELLAAAFVLVLGAALLAGLWSLGPG
jgi:nickel/cobalt transporter (NicO) family protein